MSISLIDFHSKRCQDRFQATNGLIRTEIFGAAGQTLAHRLVKVKARFSYWPFYKVVLGRLL